ncbi:hypothetical protein ACFXPZ_39705 [Streptomyces sp. NPDC059101]|uniref:hypothetical protein n=1 Tax=Streptomyces sp. NPDC059101 TaxID=3346728 RepID=UPI0036B659BA
MTTRQPDPTHQPGTTRPPQTARAAFSPPIPHPLAPLPTLAVQQALEALQRPAGTQQPGAVMALACGGTNGAPVLAVAIGHTTAAAPVPAAAPPVNLTPPAGPPAGPPANPPTPADDPADNPAPAQSSWRAVVAVCALLTVAVVGGVLTVVYPRMAPFWQVISTAATLASAAATVASTIASRDRRRGNRR